MPVVFLQRIAGPDGVLLSPQLRALKFGDGLTVTAKPDESLTGSNGDGQVTGFYEIVVDASPVTFDAVNAALAAADAPINVNGQTITNLGNPVWSADAATKFYVDTNAVPPTRLISATAPLRIDGGASADLSVNRTISITAATKSEAGSMSAADKTKLDNIEVRASTTTDSMGSVVVYTLSIADKSFYEVEFVALAIKQTSTPPAAVKRKIVLIARDGGSVSVTTAAHAQADNVDPLLAGIDVGASVSGTNVTFSVQGAAATSISWAVYLRIRSVTRP